MENREIKTEQLIHKYRHYINRMIQKTYWQAEAAIKDELEQAGLIGLWKGIQAYKQHQAAAFEQKRFVDTICAYIRYEMRNFFKTNHMIKIAGHHFRNLSEIEKLKRENPNISEKQLKALVEKANLNLLRYQNTVQLLNLASLDAPVCDGSDSEGYGFMPFYDAEIQAYFNKSYVNYIVESAFAGVNSERDKKLILKWIESIYDGKELSQKELATMFGLSGSMVGVILNRFIDLCRFVRDCEQNFVANPNGVIYLPEIRNKGAFYQGKKIPGVKWVLRNRKWKVTISAGKNKTVFIGYFETLEEAVKARRNAELQYRGKSAIVI